jgi:hypothetical protein
VEYELPWIRKEFGLPFGLLVDTLHVFNAGAAELVLRYPGVNQELICEYACAPHQACRACSQLAAGRCNLWKAAG